MRSRSKPSARSSRAARASPPQRHLIAVGHTIDSAEAIYGLGGDGARASEQSEKEMPTPKWATLISAPIGVGVLSAAAQEREACPRLRRDDRQHHQAQQAWRRARQHAGRMRRPTSPAGLAGHTPPNLRAAPGATAVTSGESALHQGRESTRRRGLHHRRVRPQLRRLWAKTLRCRRMLREHRSGAADRSATLWGLVRLT